jgi:[protein-PII] uridylyltransferase
MSIQSPRSSELRDLYDAESSKFHQQFCASKDGLGFLKQRSALVDSIALRLWGECITPEKGGPSGVVLAALGDFGMGSLFPYSDVDLLFLHSADDSAEKFKDSTHRFSQAMRDLPLKLNATTRMFSEYAQFDSDDPASILCLLDFRYLAGDEELFSNLKDRLIPERMAQESQVLVGHLAEITRTRHRKFGNTVFHLEPNVEDGPGGYRDYALACRPGHGLHLEPAWIWRNSMAGPDWTLFSLRRFEIRSTRRGSFLPPFAAFSIFVTDAMTTY